MIKAVIFDMDGLLFDTERLDLRAWSYAGEQMGYTITEELSISTIGMVDENVQEALKAELGGDLDYPALKKHRANYVDAFVEQFGVPVKAGVREAVEFLNKAGYRLAVASSSEKRQVEDYLARTGLLRFFDGIAGGDMVEHGKPDPEIFLKAAALLNVQPGECLVLEDSPRGILAACRAGMRPVMVPDLVQPSPGERELAWACLDRIDGIIALLAGLA